MLMMILVMMIMMMTTVEPRTKPVEIKCEFFKTV